MQKISVIVPIYNSASTLNETLECLINQTYQNLEIILINDGSTDEGINICKKYQKKDKRIILISQKNKGVGAARNRGLDKAQGEYVFFLDADDTIELNYFELMLKQLLEKKLDIIGSNIRVSTTDFSFKPYEKYGNQMFEDNVHIIQKYLSFMISTAVWGKLYKKELIGKTRFPHFNINEDFIFGWEIMKKARNFYQLNETHYNYNINSQPSLTKQNFNQDNMTLVAHAQTVLKDVQTIYPNLEYEGNNYFKACILHNYVIYSEYLKTASQELYLDFKNLMESYLQDVESLDYTLVEPEQKINIPELMAYVNKTIQEKGGYQKCL